MQRNQDFSNELIFATEQWLSLAVGLACLAVFIWAALDGREVFPLRHLSHLGSNAVVAIGWLLTVSVGLLGVTLMRFAFYKRSEPETGARPAHREPGRENGNSTGRTTGPKLVATNTGRG